MLDIETNYFCDDREGRVVDHNIVRSVLLRLVISAGIERPDNTTALDVAVSSNPVQNDIINRLRGVTIICSLLCPELVHELLVGTSFFLGRYG